VSLPGTRTLWEEGHEPGREVVALGVALALTVAAVDLLLTGRVGWLFDLGFVALCVALALAVRHGDFFTVGVLPPLLMLSTFLLLAMTRSEAIADAHDGLLPAVVAGLSHHALALALAYVTTLGVLVVRRRVARVRDELEPLTRSGPGRRLPA
jgi:hypothetical protein